MVAAERLPYGERIRHDLVMKLGRAVAQDGEPARAEVLLDSALAGLVASSGPESHDAAFCHVVRGKLRESLGRRDEAEADFEQARQVAARLKGSQALLADALLASGSLRRAEGRLVEAVTLLEDALRIRREASGASHRETITALMTLAEALFANGKLDRLIEVKRDEVEARTVADGADDAQTLLCTGMLAELLRLRDKAEQAEALLAKALGTATAKHEPGDDLVTDLRFKQARALHDLGRAAEAEGAADEISRLRTSLHGPGDEIALRPRTLRAEWAEQDKRPIEARRLWLESWRDASMLPESSELRWVICIKLGLNHAHCDELAQAEPLVAEGHRRLAQLVGENRGDVRSAAASLAKIRAALGR